MSWASKALRKVKKTIRKGTKLVPGLAAMAPLGGKAQLASAIQGLQTGAALAGGGALGGAPVPPAPGVLPMSLHGSDWAAILAQGLGGMKAAQPGAGVFGGGGVAAQAASSFLPAIIGAIGKKGASKAVQVIGGGAAGGVLLEEALNSDWNPFNDVAKRRRINPLNVRAARRAIRRIKAVRKITASIERSLPKAKARMHHHHPFARKR